MSRRSRTPRTGGPAWRLAAMGVALAAAACAAPTRIAVPPELPLTTREDSFDIRWAIERGTGSVRAVGTVYSRVGREVRLSLGFYGLDRDGRLVSHGYTPVRFRFAQEPAAFEVSLKPTGREERFELHVIEWAFFPGPRGS